jgi:hypothetical protein
LWSITGAFVGQFGAHLWLLDLPASWRTREAPALDAKDAFDLDMARPAPRRRQTILLAEDTPVADMALLRTLNSPRAPHAAASAVAPPPRISFVDTGTLQPMLDGADTAQPRGGAAHAPEEVARVLTASMVNRLRRVTSNRLRATDQEDPSGRDLRRSFVSMRSSKARGCVENWCRDP